MLTKPRRSAQTPNFNVSFGHCAGAAGDGQGFGFGFGLHLPQALESVAHKRIEKIRMDAESLLLEAMAIALTQA